MVSKTPTAKLYQPLPDAGSTIRVLAFDSEGSSCNDTSPSDPHPLRLKLETISLRDYTPQYQSFAEKENISKIVSHRRRLIAWCRHLDENPCCNDGSSKRNEDAPQPSEYRFVWGDFATLSYVWGTEEDSTPVIINGVRIKVRPNLGAALQSLRETSGRFTGRFRLWVDSLCINQADDVERAQQVSMMRDIYGMAWGVIAWIGSATDTSFKGLQLLRTLSAHADATKAANLLMELEREPEKLGRGSWQAMHELALRPFWTRLWIIQELVLGCHFVRIHCGKDTIDWDTFITGISTLHVHFWVAKNQLILRDRQAAGLVQGPINVRELHLLFKDIKPLTDKQAEGAQPWVDLRRLINISADCKATNPRDKVYGMLAMMDPELASRISVNYGLTPEQVFADVAIANYETYQNLELLGHCNMSTLPGCPTWAPSWDWAQRNRDGTFKDQYHASRGHPCVFTIDRHQMKLKCQAILIDVVDGIGGKRRNRFNYIQGSIKTADSVLSAYGDRQATQYALARAIVGDATWSITIEQVKNPLGILNLPPTFREGKPRFESLGWQRAVRDGGYYYSWERWLGANRKFRIAGRCLEDYFEWPIPEGVEEASCFGKKGEFERMITWRRLATTTKGYIGWVPEILGDEHSVSQATKGDVVAVIMGCKTPVILRLCGGNVYKVVGEAYFLGLMAGEAIQMMDRGEITLSSIELV